MKLIPRNPFPHTLHEMIVSKIKRNKENLLGEKLKSYFNLQNCILTNSGRFALYLILKSLLKENDEIIVPAFSCNVILGSIEASKVKPIFADVNPNTLNMELEDIKEKITADTKAILATHQFGYPCEIDKIMSYAKKKDILVIEDAAPALGALYKGKKVGTFGDVSFISFQKSKVISTINGGLIISKSKDIFDIISNLAENIRYKEERLIFTKSLIEKILLNPILYQYIFSGWRYLTKNEYSTAYKLNTEDDFYKSPTRMTKFQENLGLYQFEKLDDILEKRQKTARYYINSLKEFRQITLPQIPNKNKTHTYSRFPILIRNKYKFHEEVRKKGVDLGFTFSYILPQYFQSEGARNYHNAKYIADNILHIPITNNLELNYKIISSITTVINEWLPILKV